jgi:RHS repeat-associated protein
MRTAFGRAAIAVAVLVSTMFAQAQDADIYRERIRSWSSIGPLPASAFGEQYDLYKGELSFRQEDLRLPGIGPDIVIARVFKAGSGQDIVESAAFGDWEISVPRLVSKSGPGVLGSNANTTCSTSGFTVLFAQGFQLREWWNGVQLVDQEGTTRDVLTRVAENPLAPGGQTANYPFLTKDNWQLSCPETGANDIKGKDFVAIAPDGTKYWFTQLVTSDGFQGISKPAANGKWLHAVITKAMLLVTRIEDKSGNYLTYTYNGSQLQRIDGSDGRSVVLTWSGAHVTGMTVAGKTWNYQYSGTYPYPLSRLTYPDGSAMSFDLEALAEVTTSAVKANCDTTPTVNSILEGLPNGTMVSGHITGPSGLTGTFTLSLKVKGRGGVNYQCIAGTQDDPDDHVSVSPFYLTNSLVTRQYTGPGVNSTWQYDYGEPNASYSTCTTCSATETTTMTDPAGNVTRYTYSNAWTAYEGKQISIEEGVTAAGTERVTTFEYAPTDGMAYPSRAGLLPMPNDPAVNHLPAITYSPMLQKTVTQQQKSFNWKVEPTSSGCGGLPLYCFDYLARPVMVTMNSNLGAGGSRTETTAYDDKPGPWILGNVASVSVSGVAVHSVDNVYDDLGRLLNTKKFGIPQKSYTYFTDPNDLAKGAVATMADGAGHTAHYSNYKRGFPQDVTFADASTLHVDVDDYARITSYVDQNGYQTCYAYDDVGRVTKITFPSQTQPSTCSDSGGWNATNLSYVQESQPAFGLAEWHWKITATTGNSIQETYLDGLWRPVMTRAYDSQDAANTRKVVVKGYDPNGKIAFESYPQRQADTFPPTNVDSVNIRTPGTRTFYDHLLRVSEVDADSELDVLRTKTAYLDGFQTQVTNPRNFVSVQSFWALDKPEDAQLAGAVLAQGTPRQANVSITRDLFGKPTSISRGGSYGGQAVNVTRSYVYDAGQRLCKTLEPELVATVQDYDDAGNVKWRAPGVNLPNAACDTGAVAESAKITYTYTPLNQLWTVVYGDGSPGIVRTYSPDGLLATIATDGGKSSLWNYHYNTVRLLDQETLAYNGNSVEFDRAYDANQHPTSLRYPDSQTVNFGPNALGEQTQVGNYASGVAYHPNGGVSAFTYGNQILHTQSQNLRGLPSLNQDGSVLKDQYSYDANGNVSRIEDQRGSPAGGAFTRDMGYDELDRLIAAVAPAGWGVASYDYDPVDNLRVSNVGTRSNTLNYDGKNLLASLVTNGASTPYGYDARGNINSKGAQSFGFDLGNRLKTVGVNAGYVYDGQGRRIEVQNQDGRRLQVYSQGGQLLWAEAYGSTSVPAQISYSCSTGVLSNGQCVSTNTYAGVPGYACNAGDTLGGSTCTHTTSGTYGANPTGYSCNAGDSLSGSTCTHTTTNTYGATVNGYTCNAGDSLSGSTCTHTTSSPYSGTPTGYSCNAGDSLSGSTCTHTTSNAYGGSPTGYSCNAGDSLSGSTCTHTTSNTYGGSVTGYSCNAGDSLSGDTCTHTSTSAATPNYSCPSGYSLSGTTCSKTSSTAATFSGNCNGIGSPVADASSPNGYVCTEVVYVDSPADGLQECQNDASASGLSLLRAQPKGAHNYTCTFVAQGSYSCPSGGTLSGTQCTSSSSQAASVSYSCSSGTLSGSQCVSSSTYAGTVTGYSCNAGDSLSGSTCTHTTSNTYAGTVTGYSCNAGDSLSGSTCTHTTSNSYAGNVTGYSCNAGDSLSGSTCTHTATNTYTGTVSAYSCTPGDSLSGSTCTHTATNTYGGAVTGYSCNSGDSLSGSTCTHTASGTYAAAVTGYTCNSGDSLSDSTCTHTSTASPTTTYSCTTGTLSGQQCTGISTTSKTAYIYLGSKQIAEVKDGVTQYVHVDALGSPVAHTDGGKTELNRTKYEPYGFTAGDTKPGVNMQGQVTTGSAIGFTGHVNDADTDLVYMQQRYYDPTAGRFLSVDPVVTDANTGKGFGLYTYVDNNPYSKIDPDGRDVMGWVHGALTGASFCPSVCGSAFSAIDGAVSLAQGDRVGAGISFAAAAIGIVSDAGAAKVAAMAVKEASTAGKVESGVTKLFHYTDAAGAKAIEESGMIIPNAKGQVFLTAEKLSPEAVKDTLFIGNAGSKGSHVVEVEMKSGAVVKAGKNENELIHQGTIRNGRQADLTVKPNEN